MTARISTILAVLCIISGAASAAAVDDAIPWQGMTGIILLQPGDPLSKIACPPTAEGDLRPRPELSIFDEKDEHGQPKRPFTRIKNTTGSVAVFVDQNLPRPTVRGVLNTPTGSVEGEPGGAVVALVPYGAR